MSKNTPISHVKARKEKHTKIFKRAEQYLNEYRSNKKTDLALKREAAKAGNFYVPDEPKLAFVVRIKGINKIHPRPRKVLQLLRLRQINNGVFVKLNKATTQMLRIADPYIAWGYPSQKSIRQLVYKRGYVKDNGQRIALTDNDIVEKYLGNFCINYKQPKNGNKARQKRLRFIYEFKLYIMELLIVPPFLWACALGRFIVYDRYYKL
jgi:60S ribosomal protein uL30